MNENLTIRGLPHSLALDGWWLDAQTPGDGGGGTSPTKTQARLPRRGLVILALVLLGDLLFWRHAPGLSVALFAFAIFALAVSDARPAAWRRPALLLFVATLPVVDYLQLLSVAFLAAGLAVALTWVRHPEAPGAILVQAAARFLRRLPLNWLSLLDPRRLTTWRGPPVRGRGAALRSILRNWAFPIGGSLVFAALLMDANPVLARLVDVDIDLWQGLRRALLWTGIAIFVAPFLAPVPLPQAVIKPPPLPGRRRLEIGLNVGSVLRALVLFNLLIGVQSLTDLSILVGGAELPAGMTLAEYAHRGAYPLLMTAILAGAFALAARPFLHEHRTVKPLLLLWLAQNVVLCGAAALRLDLYFEAFGLTYLRIYALIWMALVAAGLAIALWQVLAGYPNGWLIRRAAALGLVALYIFSFVNFAQIIAAENVARPDPDRYYLCTLGPPSAGPIIESGIGMVHDGFVDLDVCWFRAPQIEGWRDWGFRTWLASRYVQRVTMAERP